VHNACIESFNNRLRDESLSRRHWFVGPAIVAACIHNSRDDHNHTGLTPCGLHSAGHVRAVAPLLSMADLSATGSQSSAVDRRLWSWGSATGLPLRTRMSVTLTPFARVGFAIQAMTRMFE